VPDRPLVIGLAGGVGAGKSTVARAFERLGCFVSDSDKAAKRELDKPEVVQTLKNWWGEGIVDDSGRIDRKAIASIVFDDPAQRERLEALIHPRLKAGRAALIERAHRACAPAVIIDAPLVFEAGLEKECDLVVFVDAPRDVRLERVRRSRGWGDGELDRRERAQWSLEEKKRLSDAVVDNGGDDPEAMREACQRILEEARSERADR